MSLSPEHNQLLAFGWDYSADCYGKDGFYTRKSGDVTLGVEYHSGTWSANCSTLGGGTISVSGYPTSEAAIKALRATATHALAVIPAAGAVMTPTPTPTPGAPVDTVIDAETIREAFRAAKIRGKIVLNYLGGLRNRPRP